MTRRAAELLLPFVPGVSVDNMWLCSPCRDAIRDGKVIPPTLKILLVGKRPRLFGHRREGAFAPCPAMQRIVLERAHQVSESFVTEGFCVAPGTWMLEQNGNHADPLGPGLSERGRDEDDKPCARQCNADPAAIRSTRDDEGHRDLLPVRDRRLRRTTAEVCPILLLFPGEDCLYCDVE